MNLVRPALALDPRSFGRRPSFTWREPAKPLFRLSDDVKLFATTFAAGFLFVSVMIF